MKQNVNLAIENEIDCKLWSSLRYRFSLCDDINVASLIDLTNAQLQVKGPSQGLLSNKQDIGCVN